VKLGREIFGEHRRSNGYTEEKKMIFIDTDIFVQDFKLKDLYDLSII